MASTLKRALDADQIRELARLSSMAFERMQRDRKALRLAERDVERLSTEMEVIRARARPKTERQKLEPVILCAKRSFGSEDAALKSCATLGHTVRAYECPHCRKWHITKQVYDT